MGKDNSENIEKREKVRDAIVGYLTEGLWFKDACIMAGSSEATGHRWKNEDKSFDSRVEAGILEYKKRMINLVNLGSIKDGKLALEVLRTRWPEEWSNKLQITGKDGGPIEMEVPDLVDWLKENAKNIK